MYVVIERNAQTLDCSLYIKLIFPSPLPFSYTGRVELPDNLKSYFRPVAMMVPDTNMIAEVSLFVNGFTTASVLGLKLSRFYEMIKSQISQQVSAICRCDELLGIN